MTQLTKSQIIELRARAIAENLHKTYFSDLVRRAGCQLNWDNLHKLEKEDFYKIAEATIEADEKAGVLMLVEKECAIKHPANTAWDLMNRLKNKVMFDAWDRNKEQIVIQKGLDITFEIGYREGVTACKHAMLGGELVANTPVYQCKKEAK